MSKKASKRTDCKKPPRKSNKKKVTRIERKDHTRDPKMFAPIQPAKRPRPGDSSGGNPPEKKN